MLKSFAPVFRSLILLALCALPLLTQAATQKEAPLDLSILKQRDALRPYMTSQQRMAYIDAAQVIKEGESDIRSGQNLQAQKASALNPDKDLKPLHERGKKLVESGHAKIRSGQQTMVELLTAVKTHKAANQAIAAKKYNFQLIEETYASALEQAATKTLKNCRSAGYNNIFYDGLRIITAEQNIKADLKLHNATYDTFIQADGTRFNVKVPLGLKFTKDDSTAEYAFQYDNASVYEGEKIALLAIEVIAPGSGSDALLSVSALDLNSQRLISSVLFYIADASEVLAPDTEVTVASDEEASEAASDEIAQIATDAPTTVIESPRSIPVSVTINEQNQLIKKLSGLASPYSFETVVTAETAAQSILVANLLKDTLLKNSTLILVDGSYIQRSYLPTESSESLSAATATLAVTQTADHYTMIANAHESDRSLEVGTVTLNLPE